MIQLKQLKRLKYESFEYGKYEKLKKIFLDYDFEPEDLEELDLSNEKAQSLPNIHCLELLNNLQVLILTNNQIQKFPGIQLAKLLPNLQVFDISYNNVEDLDDLIDMGSLDDLRILDLQGNYVTTYITKINIIEMLLCPKKYLKYNPIKILTAGYNQIPVARLSGPAFEQQKQDRRVIERFPEELRPDELINTVSKYNHKNTLGKYSLEACPVPRKTRFKNLEYLNGQPITKLDIIRVTGVKHFKLVLEDNRSIVVKKRPQTCQDKKIKRNHKINNQYLKKYIKRINRLMEDNEEYNPIKQNDEELDAETLLVQLTQKEIKNKNKQLIDPKKFSKELWQIPLDIQYKDAEYTIGIEDFKKQEKEYQNEKRLKIETKKQKAKDKRRKRLEIKLGKKGLRPPTQQDSSEQDVDSDPEMKRLFRFRSKPLKPKMNLSRDDDLSYRSSESSLQENHSSHSQNSYTNSSDEEVDVEDKNVKKKKIALVIGEQQQSALELKRQMNQAQKKKINDKKEFIQGKKRVEFVIPQGRQQGVPQNYPPEIIEDTQQQHIQYQQQQKQREQLQQQQEQLQKNEDQDEVQIIPLESLHKLYPIGPSVIYSYGQVTADNQVLQVQQFRMAQPSLSAQRIVSAGIKQETMQTFNVKNKLTAQRQTVTSADVVAESLTNLEKQVKIAQKERQQLEELHKNNDAFLIIDTQNKTSKERPHTSLPSKETQELLDKGQVRVKNFWREMERVKVKGDLDKVEYQKVKIPIESLVPTVEQGIPEELRIKFLFDDKNEKYKELVYYKKILEESRNIREASKEMDGKLEIQGIKPYPESQFKASDFNTVFNYLKEDPNFQIQNSYDPANQVVANVARRKQFQRGNEKILPSQNAKISTFDMREIIYGANEYDPQNEPKLVEKEIIAQLKQEKGITMIQRDKLYLWLEILDDINLKKTKTDEKRLQRIEKKDIERAQSFAHLAYHYQKLKKYVPEDKLQKYVKLMGIPLDEIIQENEQNAKIPRMQKDSKSQSRLIINSLDKQGKAQSKSQMNIRKPISKEVKELEFTKQINQVVQQKADIIEREQEINAKRTQNMKDEMLSDNGYMAEHHPNIVKFMKEKEKQKASIIKPQQTFEEMMDQNVRKIQDQFQKKGTGAVSIEEQMMRYAQNFNEKVRNRERLQTNMKQYIEGTQKKIDEFWQWEQQEREHRNDKTYCFKRYVKMVREGQIKIM